MENEYNKIKSMSLSELEEYKTIVSNKFYDYWNWFSESLPKDIKTEDLEKKREHFYKSEPVKRVKMLMKMIDERISDVKGAIASVSSGVDRDVSDLKKVSLNTDEAREIYKDWGKNQGIPMFMLAKKTASELARQKNELERKIDVMLENGNISQEKADELYEQVYTVSNYYSTLERKSGKSK